MLYEGLSRINAQKLCQLHIQLCDNRDNPVSIPPQKPQLTLETFYNRHKIMINNTVFEDSYDSFHFWGFISESIKKSHTNLPYILKNQYSNADKVYANLTESVTNMKNDGDKGPSFTQAIFDLPRDIMGDFANDVYRYIILQPLYRHHIYSPIMCLLVLIDIMHSMADVYIHKSLGVEGKKKLSMYMEAPFTFDQIKSIRWMSEIEKEMLSDECQVHAAQIRKNGKNEKNKKNK